MNEIIRRLLGALRRSEIDRGLEEEIQFHIDHQTEKNLRLGMSAAEARRNAMVKFGGVERIRERTRDEYRPMLLEDVARDLKYGARSLLRAPGFSLVAILTLGLGIGAATAVFSVVYSVLLSPLPYPAGHRIMQLMQVDKDGKSSRFVSDPNFADWKEQSRSFSAMTAMRMTGLMPVTGDFEPHRARLTAVTREFFDVMQVRPAYGREWRADEQVENGTPTAIVSFEYARRYLGGERAALGKNITLQQEVSLEVIGVMPAGFDYPLGTEVWWPKELNGTSPYRTGHNFQIVARLRDGVAQEQAARELSTISRALKARYGEDTWMSDAQVVSLHEVITGSSKRSLLILLGAAGFLLLISCANVSNLLLARGAARQRELAVRLAMGASRWRLGRQLLAESLVLCLAGGLVGVLTAFWGVRTLLAIEPGSIPRVEQVGINWVALAFALAVSLATACLLGLVLSWRAGGKDLRSTISEGQRTMSGSRSSQHVRDGLVVAQIALTLVLLGAAGLLTRSFLRVMSIDKGYSTATDALLIDLTMPSARGQAEQYARQIRFQEELAARLRALPGATGVGIVNDLPLGGGGGIYANGQFIEMTHPDEFKSYEDFQKLTEAEAKARVGYADYRAATGEYFRLLRIPLLRGRLFEPGDVESAPHVAVISQSLAEERWPEQDPIGRFIQYGNMDSDVRGFRIVGIVGDIREGSPEFPPRPTFYANAAQRAAAMRTFTVIVRADNPSALATPAQRIIRELDPELPIQTRNLSDALDRLFATRRFSLMLIGVFAVAALVLATLGIYGVISYLVSQRTREIGIRMALGARGPDLVRLIVGKGAVLAAIGTIIGLAGTLGLGRFIKGMLYGVSTLDPIAFGSVIGLVGTAVIAASYIPARRALRVAPSVTLRE